MGWIICPRLDPNSDSTSIKPLGKYHDESGQWDGFAGLVNGDL